MRRAGAVAAGLTVLAAWGGSAHGQSQLPTTQPGLLTIYIEEIKPGRQADHAANEAGWPAAFAKANSPTYYLAMSSLTGTPHVWFVVPYASNAAEGEDMRRNDSDPTLSAELARLGRADGEYLAGQRVVRAMARPDLSHGAFPDLTRARFWDITTFEVRPGGVPQFEAAAKAYAAIAERVAPGEVSFRTYQVTAGLSGAVFLVFASVNEYAGFDRMTARSMRIGQAMTAEERAIFEAYGREAELRTTTHRYALDAGMSYVDAATKAADPAFWNR